LIFRSPGTARLPAPLRLWLCLRLRLASV